MMTFSRSSGVLLHPTSLPGKYGIGDLGPNVYKFIDFLSRSGCKLWQILPLGPTGYGDSPYQSFSAFAGNPYLVSPELLINDGFLTGDDLHDMPNFDPERVDFGLLFTWKPIILDRAFERFITSGSAPIKQEFESYCLDESYWLDDFALFMALKDINQGNPWNMWPIDQRKRQPEALNKIIEEKTLQINQQKFRQFLFSRQWSSVKKYANGKGIQIIGDIPIFVAMDSSDAWAHPELFFLDDNCQPKVVAGVPPDYFSATGQLWGNPLYDWEKHEKSGFKWWIQRIRSTLHTVDIVRIDHFRGFSAYWEIPGEAVNAVQGRWVRGPGSKLFQAIQTALGTELPIIAEDLGEITPDVFELRDKFKLPGMKILQFAFSGPDNLFLPHLYPQNCVVYTGTHDNDTSIGWYLAAPEKERDFYRRYLNTNDQDIAGDMIRVIWSSVAVFAIAPIQDFLRLGTEARMNFPGKVGGYWTWRMKENDLDDGLANRIRELNWLYKR